jgi:hypothetical protein
MAAKYKPTTPEPAEEIKPSESPLILSQSDHAKLSDKEKVEFRAKGGTVSNQ